MGEGADKRQQGVGNRNLARGAFQLINNGNLGEEWGS